MSEETVAVDGATDEAPEADPTPPVPLAAEALAAEPLAAEALAVEPLPAEPLAAEALAVEPLPAEPLAAEALAVEPLPAEPLPAPDCRLSFAGVELVLPDTNPVLVLQEAEVPYRELRIPIGMPEGVAIAYAARGIATPRPLTHELFVNVMRSFGITLEVLRITEVRGSSYSAEISLNGRPGPRTVGCRLSDGIALALRQPLPVPIMAAAAVMETASTSPR